MQRDRVKHMPGGANNRRKHLSAMFRWAVEKTETKVTSNPMRDVKPIKAVGRGFYPRTTSDLAKYDERHPIGTKARLAMGMLLFLGPRRQDMGSTGL